MLHGQGEPIVTEQEQAEGKQEGRNGWRERCGGDGTCGVPQPKGWHRWSRQEEADVVCRAG